MSQFGKPKPALLLQTRICLVFSKPTGADVDKRNINFELRKVTRLLKIHVLRFDYDIGNQTKYTKFHHTEGFTYHKSSFISLQVNKTNLENAHVNKPSCFGHWI